MAFRIRTEQTPSKETVDPYSGLVSDRPKISVKKKTGQCIRETNVLKGTNPDKL